MWWGQNKKCISLQGLKRNCSLPILEERKCVHYLKRLKRKDFVHFIYGCSFGVIDIFLFSKVECNALLCLFKEKNALVR